MSGDSGSPYECWMLLRVKVGPDLVGHVRVAHIFSGPTGFREAQAEQRRAGGFIVEAHGWVLGSDDGVPGAIVRELAP